MTTSPLDFMDLNAGIDHERARHRARRAAGEAFRAWQQAANSREADAAQTEAARRRWIASELGAAGAPPSCR